METIIIASLLKKALVKTVTIKRKKAFFGITTICVSFDSFVVLMIEIDWNKIVKIKSSYSFDKIHINNKNFY